MIGAITAGLQGVSSPIAPPVTGNNILYLDPSNPTSYSGGSTWTDLSSSANNFSLYSTSSGGSGLGTYVSFNGSSSYGNLGHNLFASQNTTSSTIQMWIYQTANTQSEWASQWNTATSGQNYFIGLRGYSGSTATFKVGDNFSVANVQVGANSWVNWTVVNDVAGNNAYVYRNGILQGSYGQHLTETGTQSMYLAVQGNLGAEFYQGYMGVTLAYSRALSSTEVNTNFNYYKSRYGL